MSNLSLMFGCRKKGRGHTWARVVKVNLRDLNFDNLGGGGGGVGVKTIKNAEKLKVVFSQIHVGLTKISAKS